ARPPRRASGGRGAVLDTGPPDGGAGGGGRTCWTPAPAGPTTGSPAARPAAGSTGAARMPGGWRPSWRGRQPAEPRARLDVVVQVKRVYDAPDASDGKRVLVDRLWPRGLRKDAAALHD